MNNSYNFADFIGLNLDTNTEQKLGHTQTKLESTDPTDHWPAPSPHQDQQPIRTRRPDTKPV
jgi:hypothetical protein